MWMSGMVLCDQSSSWALQRSPSGRSDCQLRSFKVYLLEISARAGNVPSLGECAGFIPRMSCSVAEMCEQPVTSADELPCAFRSRAIMMPLAIKFKYVPKLAYISGTVATAGNRRDPHIAYEQPINTPLHSDNNADEPPLTAAFIADRSSAQRRVRASDGCYSCSH